MIKNFLTVAFRNFLRQRFYSVINIIGLATGLTCALFILLWVKDEVDTDRFHEHDRRLFRVVANFRLPDGEVITWTITPGPLAENIRENDPEVEWAVRTQSAGDHLMQYGEKRMMERGFFADHDFFKLFTFEVLRGKISEDQNDISQISISRRLAQKLFGDADPIGQTVTVDTKRAFTVQAVFEDPPHHSSLRFDFILPFEVFKKQRGENFNWDNYDHPLYLALHDPSQAEALVQKISDRVALTRETSDDEKVEFYLQPFGEQYLHGKFVNGRPSGGRIEYVKIFSLVAVFIIIIACINFTNMATARAVNRAKEVGIRKVVGAQRKSLILQFLAESMLITATGMFVAIAVVFMTLPFFNALVGKQIELYLNDSTLIGSMVFIILITGSPSSQTSSLFCPVTSP